MRFLSFINKKSRRVLLVAFDVFCFAFINFFFYASGNLVDSPLNYDLRKFIDNACLMAIFIFGVRFILRMYRNIWRYSNTRVYFKLVWADCFSGILAVFCSRILGVYTGVWHFLIVTSLNALLTLLSRFTYQLLYRWSNQHSAEKSNKINIAIVGAGQLGASLAEELITNPNAHYNPVCFVDKSYGKIGNSVSELPVYGEDRLSEFVELLDIKEFVIAIANADSNTLNMLYEKYSKFGCKVKIYDSPLQDNGNEFKKVIRTFQIEDLLFRNPILIENADSLDYYKGKTVLVTGGGGSIGSELCRQIAKCKPKKLLIFEIYENNAYDIEQELVRKYGEKLNLCVEIGSVRDRKRLDEVFKIHRPDIVFHAAAHKHVPLMEHSSSEAVKNNVLGTYNTADMAEKYEAEKFILVSTDKAVNPTNIMGASKRVCEMVIQCRTDSNTSFAAVRFGNVLGSNGSVIPLFKKQIEQGGPITLTDRRIIRYFMTIPEASQLVMHAGRMAKKGELFVLDMGKPVKIYDLACDMIRLSGFEPEKDIKIDEIGLRPGEKLYEELLMKSEELDKTDNDLIFIEHDAPLSRAEVDSKIKVLTDAVESAYGIGNADILKNAIAKVVPTYKTCEAVNSCAEKSEEMKMANA